MNERLTIQDLTDLLASRHGMSKKDAEAFVKEFFLLIEEALAVDNYLKIKGLGTFRLIDVDSRESVNVNTGERFQIKGHTKVSFTADANLRDTINKPFAHFETIVLNDGTVLDDTPIEDVEEDTEDTPVEIKEGTIVIDENIHNEVASEDEDLEDIVIEEGAEEKSVIEDEPIQEIKQQEKEVLPLPIADVHKETEPTAEQIIAQELQEVTMKLKSTFELQPQAITNMDSVKKEKSPVLFLVTAIIIVLLLCGGAILFIYYPDLFTSSSNKEVLDMPVVSQLQKQEAQLTDTIDKKDTVKKTTVEAVKPQFEVKTEMKGSLASQQPSSPVYSDAATYTITGTQNTHTIKVGESLTKVSLKYYGTKALWPYIVKHNPEVIKNPDNVPHGTIIKIPVLTQK